MQRSIFAVVLGLFLAVGLQAESLKEKTARADAEKDLKTKIDEINTACGTHMKATIDWNSFSKQFTDGHNEGAAQSFCDYAINGFRDLCAEHGAEGKKTAAKFKEIKCSFGKKAVKHSGSTLNVSYGWSDSEAGSDVKAYLENM
jgi:hypothetical protein